MPPLIDFLRSVANHPGEHDAFRRDPEGYLDDHGYPGIDPQDASDAMSLVADTLPPSVAARLVAPAETGTPLHDLDPVGVVAATPDWAVADGDALDDDALDDDALDDVLDDHLLDDLELDDLAAPHPDVGLDTDDTIDLDDDGIGLGLTGPEEGVGEAFGGDDWSDDLDVGSF